MRPPSHQRNSEAPHSKLEPPEGDERECAPILGMPGPSDRPASSYRKLGSNR